MNDNWVVKWEQAKAGLCTSRKSSDFIKSDPEEVLEEQRMEELDYNVNEPDTVVVLREQSSRFRASPTGACVYNYQEGDHNYAFKDFEIVAVQDSIDPSILANTSISFLVASRHFFIPTEYALLMANIAGKYPYVDESDPSLMVYPVLVTCGMPGGVLVPTKDIISRSASRRGSISFRGQTRNIEMFMRFKKHDKRHLPLPEIETDGNMFGCFPITSDPTLLRPNMYGECEVDTNHLMGFIIPYRSFMVGITSVKLIIERHNLSQPFTEIVFDQEDIHLVKHPTGKKLCYIFGFSSAFRDPERFVQWVKNDTIAISTVDDPHYGAATCHKHRTPQVVDFADHTCDIKIEMDIDESEDFYEPKTSCDSDNTNSFGDDEFWEENPSPRFPIYPVEEAFLGLTYKEFAMHV